VRCEADEMMRQDPKRLNEAVSVGPTDRQTAKLDAARALSRRSQALLAAAGMEVPERRWYVLTVQPGKDFAVDNALEDAGIEHWMATWQRVVLGRVRRPKGGGRRVVTLPFFPGYVFVKVAWTPYVWEGLRTIEGVQSVIGTAVSPSSVSEQVLCKFKVMLDDPVAQKELAATLKLGDTVRVDDGPFASFPAEVMAVDEEACRALIEVMIFGRAVPVDLDLARITKIE
jgi:transcriptional antiterminator NusG